MVVLATPAFAAMDSMLTARNPSSRTKSMAVCKIALWRCSLLGRPFRVCCIRSVLFSAPGGGLQKLFKFFLQPKRYVAYLMFRTLRYVAYHILKEKSHDYPRCFGYWRADWYWTRHCLGFRARRCPCRYFRTTR